MRRREIAPSVDISRWSAFCAQRACKDAVYHKPQREVVLTTTSLAVSEEPDGQRVCLVLCISRTKRTGHALAELAFFSFRTDRSTMTQHQAIPIAYPCVKCRTRLMRHGVLRENLCRRMTWYPSIAVRAAVEV